MLVTKHYSKGMVQSCGSSHRTEPDPGHVCVCDGTGPGGGAGGAQCCTPASGCFPHSPPLGPGSETEWGRGQWAWGQSPPVEASGRRNVSPGGTLLGRKSGRPRTWSLLSCGRASRRPRPLTEAGCSRGSGGRREAASRHSLACWLWSTGRGCVPCSAPPWGQGARLGRWTPGPCAWSSCVPAGDVWRGTACHSQCRERLLCLVCSYRLPATQITSNLFLSTQRRSQCVNIWAAVLWLVLGADNQLPIVKWPTGARVIFC